MNDRPERLAPQLLTSDQLADRVQSLEARCGQIANLVKSARQEMHDGLSQQIVGVTMIAARLADTMKAEGAPQADKAEQLAMAIEDAKRQTLALAERLKQLESELQG